MNDIQSAAKELIDRYGDNAVDIAKDRAKQLELAADWPAHAIATRVLNAVERLVVASPNE